MTDAGPSYFWTKVWSRPSAPERDALLFRFSGWRDRSLAMLSPGDIVVYLTSDATESDPMVRGRVAGAVEIAGEPILAADVGLTENPPATHLNEEGRYRWPYAITIRRAWHVLDTQSNDELIPGHGAVGRQGAATIHPMDANEVRRFRALRVEEQVTGQTPGAQIFSAAHRRPWRQKAGEREAAMVDPGCQLYAAIIADEHGMTVKVGSGKSAERLEVLNRYRRPSQGETLWAIGKGFVHDFETPDGARAAEDHLLARARAEGFVSRDHGEFLVGLPMRRLRELFAAAVEAGMEIEDRATVA